MKISISSKTLLSALSICQKAVNSNGIVSATSNFRFQATCNELHISSCNLEVSMETKITAMIEGEIDALIPADKITKLLSSLPEQGITIDIAPDYNITVTALSGTYELPGDNGSEFPRITTDTTTEITIPSEDLTAAIYSTAYARSVDQIQVRFTGLSMQLQTDKIQFAGCNLMLLSVFNIVGEFTTAKLLLPVSITNIIGAISIPGDCKVSFSDNSISFEYENLTVKSLLVGETYPDYMGIVPDNKTIISVPRTALLGATKRILEFSNKVSKQVFISTDNGKVTISGLDTSFKQKAKEVITIPEKEAIEISINGEFLANALSHIGSDVINIAWSTAQKPIIIREPDEINNFVMVMPLVG